MIAIDTSSWIAFFAGADPGDVDVETVSAALADHQACLPPVVLTELLGDPKLPGRVAALLLQLPPGWSRCRTSGSARLCCARSSWRGSAARDWRTR